jgi:hypothetical protein
MSYVGSTAASTVANPPNRVSQGLMSQSNINESTSVVNGGSLWTYNSSNLTTDLNTANFFSDGHLLGMRPGDILIANTHSTESSTGFLMYLGVVGAVSTSGASMSTEAFISSTATAAGGG